MRESGLKHGIWVLVCDGRKALLLQNVGDHVYPKLETRNVYEHSDPLSHDLGSDVPGRTFSGKTGRHSAIEPKDLQRISEQAFLKHVVDTVSHRILQGEIKDLVLAAPSRALGMIRHDMSPAVREVILAEFDRDYVREPVHEIERHLSEMLVGKKA